MPKKGESRRNDLSVKLEADVVTVARMVASARNITIAEYLSAILRPIVRADLDREYARLSRCEHPINPESGRPEIPKTGAPFPRGK